MKWEFFYTYFSVACRSKYFADIMEQGANDCLLVRAVPQGSKGVESLMGLLYDHFLSLINDIVTGRRGKRLKLCGMLYDLDPKTVLSKIMLS